MPEYTASTLTVIADGRQTDPWLTPSFPPGSEEPCLERGERVMFLLRRGDASVEVLSSGAWRTTWTSPKHATVVVTDRRIVMGCRSYERGSTYVGFGGLGALVAVGATAVSRVRARRATEGQCLALQWRHPWVSAVACIGTPAGWQSGLAGVLGAPVERTAVVAGQSGTRWRLVFGSLAEPDGVRMATAVASAVAADRQLDETLTDPADRAAVLRLAANVRLDVDQNRSGALAIPGARGIGWRPARAPDPR